MESIFDSAAFNSNLFFPRQDTQPTPQAAEDIFVEVEPGIKVHLRKYPFATADFSLVYFHGNGEIASDYDNLAELFSMLGAELIVCDYRGYGKSNGTPTLRGVLNDAHVILDYLKQEQKLQARFCIMGRSLGSAPAIELCSQRDDIACCVIESGYADPIPLVERRGLRVDSTTPEEDALFNNSEKIRKVTCPLLIMHGADDFLIVPQEAKLNYENAGSNIKHLEILDGVGHNDILFAQDNGYFGTLKVFLDKVLFE